MSGRRFALLVAVAVGVSLPASTAAAATVERLQRLDPFGSPYDSFYLTYTAAPGEANNLEVHLDPTAITFHDAGAPLAGTGCEQVDPATVRCGYGAPVTALLGDGDDVARIFDTRPSSADAGDWLPSSPQVRVEAGAGADSITGGPGDDVFVDTGAGEADRFTGGGGKDRVSYAGRTQPVRISLGAPGEDVLDGIKILEGGSGNDALTGDAGPNTFWGGPGKDTLRGLGGKDDLDGGGGADRVFSGPGDDDLSGDSYTSGLGRDLLDGGRGDDFLYLGAADDNAYSIGGPEYEEAADGRKDTARCGSGFDAVDFRDRFDTVRSCEAAALGPEFTFGNTLRRISRTKLRVRVGLTPGPFSEETTVVLLPRGKARPRLTKVRLIEDEGRVTLHLTRAGVRYLRNHRVVTMRSEANGDTIELRVSRQRGG